MMHRHAVLQLTNSSCSWKAGNPHPSQQDDSWRVSHKGPLSNMICGVRRWDGEMNYSISARLPFRFQCEGEFLKRLVVVKGSGLDLLFSNCC